VCVWGRGGGGGGGGGGGAGGGGPERSRKRDFLAWETLCSRWSADGASIFSVNDGKRLAQTPVREPSAWEASRARKIAQAAQVDKRVVQVQITRRMGTCVYTAKNL
jgi:hypothetical protein